MPALFVSGEDFSVSLTVLVIDDKILWWQSWSDFRPLVIIKNYQQPTDIRTLSDDELITQAEPRSVCSNNNYTNQLRCRVMSDSPRGIYSEIEGKIRILREILSFGCSVSGRISRFSFSCSSYFRVSCKNKYIPLLISITMLILNKTTCYS